MLININMFESKAKNDESQYTNKRVMNSIHYCAIYFIDLIYI